MLLRRINRLRLSSRWLFANTTVFGSHGSPKESPQRECKENTSSGVLRACVTTRLNIREFLYDVKYAN